MPSSVSAGRAWPAQDGQMRSSMISHEWHSWIYKILSLFLMDGTFYDVCTLHKEHRHDRHDTQSGLPAHRRQTRTEIRPGRLLEGPKQPGRTGRPGRGVAPAPLARAERAGLRASGRLFLLRPGAGPELYSGQFAAARARPGRCGARQLFPCGAWPLGQRQRLQLRPRRRDDEMV